MFYPLIALLAFIPEPALEHALTAPSPNWEGIIAFMLSIATLATVFFKAGRHENKVEKIATGFEDKLNGFGRRLDQTEREHSVMEGVVSTLEGMLQRQLGLHEGLASRVADYQRETAECSTENRRLRAEITQRLETISVQIARIEVELKNVARQQT